MTNFLQRNKQKVLLIVVLLFLVVLLTGCRMDSAAWYEKPYVSGWSGYGQEFQFSSFWNGLFGWPISILSWPVAWICSTIGKALGNSFFWGILFTTLIVRTLAWPIYSKQNGMSMKMNLLQPEMEKIQNKYKNRKDPQSQQRMQMETSKLYKKYKINPVGCVGTMFLQFPIFMSMYEVVKRINATTTKNVNGVEVVQLGEFALHNTKLFNFFELNTSFFDATAMHDKIFALVIAIAFGAITILSQKLSQRKAKTDSNKFTAQKAKPAGGQANQMKWMMNIMNVMFVVMALSSTSLALYWLIGAIYQMFQSQIGRVLNERKLKKLKEENNNVVI